MGRHLDQARLVAHRGSVVAFGGDISGTTMSKLSRLSNRILQTCLLSCVQGCARKQPDRTARLNRRSPQSRTAVLVHSAASACTVHGLVFVTSVVCRAIDSCLLEKLPDSLCNLSKLDALCALVASVFCSAASSLKFPNPVAVQRCVQ
jgi:hypothetical protein